MDGSYDVFESCLLVDAPGTIAGTFGLTCGASFISFWVDNSVEIGALPLDITILLSLDEVAVRIVNFEISFISTDEPNKLRFDAGMILST